MKCLFAIISASIALTAAAKGQAPHAETMKNIPYATNSHPRQTLDLYLPEGAWSQPVPLIVWIHGGAWKLGTKDWINVKHLVHEGYAIASIDYRMSGDAPFPAQIQDCNSALNFLLENAGRYGLDKNRVFIGGASAGGHLALMLGLARDEKEFNADPGFRPRAILDFFGPSDMVAFPPGEDITRLLGASASESPDKAMRASPLTYVSKSSAPVLILHGDQDESVPLQQSRALDAAMRKAGAGSELLIIKGAPHDGPLFETPDVQKRVIAFLNENTGLRAR